MCVCACRYASAAEDAPLKLIDFGTCVTIGAGEPLTSTGTPGYVAPEILQNEGHEEPGVDMWAVGVILYILLCGFPPFYQEEQSELFAAISAAHYDFPTDSAWAEVSADARGCVTQLLTLDRRGRLAARQVLDHHWVARALEGRYAAARGTTEHREVACRKLRKATFGIIAQHRMSRAILGKHTEPDEDTPDDVGAAPTTSSLHAMVASTAPEAAFSC